MPTSLTHGAPRSTAYKVKGTTLKEIWASILKNGPVDPNDKKHVAFLTTTVLKFDPEKASFTGDGKIKVEKRTGWFEAKCKIKSLAMTLDSHIDTPPMSVTGLSKAAKKEWQRFYDKALMHEFEHVKKAVKECTKISDEIDRLRGVGLGETEAEARTFAIDDLKTQIYDKYIGKQLDDRLNKIHAKFDKSTKHGEKKGAKLNTKVV